MTSRPGVSDKFPEIAVDGVELDSLAAVWPIVKPMLVPALDRGETALGLLADLMAEEAQLWAIYEHGKIIAAVVTEVLEEDDGRRECNIWAAGGTGINRWADYVEMIEDWARENGCRAVVVEKTRPGMQRLLKGYKITHITLGKVL